MRVLVVNAGSSSLKCQLIETDGKASMMKCLAEKVGSDDAYMNVSFYPDFDKTRYNVAPWASSAASRRAWSTSRAERSRSSMPLPRLSRSRPARMDSTIPHTPVSMRREATRVTCSSTMLPRVASSWMELHWQSE